MNKKMSQGRKIGIIAFFISELIAVLLTLGIVYQVFVTGQMESPYVSALLTYQGSIFVTVFSAVATKNFKKKIQALESEVGTESGPV